MSELERKIARAIDEHHDDYDYLPMYDEQGQIVTSAAARAVMRVLAEHTRVSLQAQGATIAEYIARGARR